MISMVNRAQGLRIGPAATVANAATTPMTTPATSEPRVLPRPPRITTGKTMANHSIASPGTSAWFIATSTPATAEKAPARPASTTETREASMPKATSAVRTSCPASMAEAESER